MRDQLVSEDVGTQRAKIFFCDRTQPDMRIDAAITEPSFDLARDSGYLVCVRKLNPVIENNKEFSVTQKSKAIVLFTPASFTSRHAASQNDRTRSGPGRARYVPHGRHDASVGN